MRKTREKTKNREWLFWIIIALFVVLAIYCFVEGMIVENKAPWFMASFTSLVALFTSLLWRATNKYAETTEGLLEQSEQAVEQSRLLTEATKNYTEVTKKLLEQSKEAFIQSQKVFENDLFGKIVFSVLQLAVQQKKASQKDLADLPLGMLQVIKKTDYACYERIKEIVEESWGDQGVGTVAYIRNAIKKIEEKKRKTGIPKQKKKANK